MKTFKTTTLIAFCAIFLFSCEYEAETTIEEPIVNETETGQLSLKRQGPCSGYILSIKYIETSRCLDQKRRHEQRGYNWHQKYYWANRYGCLDKYYCSNK